jgi:hypothetical protein
MKEEDSEPQVTLLQMTVGRGDERTTVSVIAGFDSTGNLVIAGQDDGAAPLRWFGDSDYEYWLRLDSEHTHRMLLALLSERFGGKNEVVSAIHRWCDAHGIAVEFTSY